jgi:protein farnesyltransferase/geranylgeranyltransferase type-1 subunit alpha
LGAELDFVERETTRNAKNYQVWNHARSILSAALENECFEAVRARAYEHVERALEEDAKNIHAWSHRAWLTRATDSWSDECAYTRRLLEDDRMNNSAWNARFHATTRLLERGDVGALERETEFALERLRFDDANESAWNYLRGLCDLAETREVDEDIARRVVRAAVDAARECVRDPAAVAAAPSRHAALFVADRLAFAAARDADASIAADAERMFHRLVSLDPVRGNYYRARVDRLRAALAL